MLQPADYQAAMPATDAAPLVQQGFDLYFRQCIKCHSVDGSGGTLGPPLDVEHGLTALLAKGDLAERISTISKFYPGSKMPDFDSLDATAVNALVAYLNQL